MATQPGSVRKCLQQVCADFQSVVLVLAHSLHSAWFAAEIRQLGLLGRAAVLQAEGVVHGRSRKTFMRTWELLQ